MPADVDTIDRSLLRPIEYHGLVRLGADGDGGYVVPERQVHQAAVLLSLGVDDNWSFDRAFVRHNPAARVIGVDGSIGPGLFARRAVGSLAAVVNSRLRGNRRRARQHLAALRTAVDYFRFFRGRHRHIARMVAPASGAAAIGLGELFSLAGPPPHGAFVKMDVEGAEYALVPVLVEHAASVGCVVAEFHRLARHAAAFNDAVRTMRQHFHIVHVHGNNYSAWDARNDFPNAVEITFVHRGLVAGTPGPSRLAYPRRDLDRPNHPARPDHPLRFDPPPAAGGGD